jgi:hypothetical protein
MGKKTHLTKKKVSTDFLPRHPSLGLTSRPTDLLWANYRAGF